MQTQYAICVTRDWYGARPTKTRLIDNETGQEWRGSRAEAREVIAEMDNTVYHLAHGEAGRPEYTIVRA